jgi:uncharacterized protein
MLTVAESRPNERALFIQRTYMHLAGAVAAFTVLEVLLFVTGIANAIAIFFLSSSFAWLGILAGFSLLGWLARSLAEQESVETQYIGLGIYVVAEPSSSCRCSTLPCRCPIRRFCLRLW